MSSFSTTIVYFSVLYAPLWSFLTVLLLRCVDWHPHKGIVVSGSKDNQQPIKLWDPKSGQVVGSTLIKWLMKFQSLSLQVLTTIHAHKSTVMDCAWNQNGNWLITASRDHLLKVWLLSSILKLLCWIFPFQLFDLRNLKEEMQTFRGHKKEASAVSFALNLLRFRPIPTFSSLCTLNVP